MYRKNECHDQWIIYANYSFLISYFQTSFVLFTVNGQACFSKFGCPNQRGWCDESITLMPVSFYDLEKKIDNKNTK
jgi:hypothetical protein